MRRRRCLPRWGKGAAVWRAWFWRAYGEKCVAGRSAFQEGLAGAPGGRGKTALLIRAHPSRAGRRARSTGGASRAAKTARSSRDRLVFATIPRGDRRALPAPAQGTSPLGIPFWGTGPHLPRLHVPPNAAGGKSLLVDLPPSAPSPTPSETQRSTHAPCSWGMGASIPSQRRWPPALPALFSNAEVGEYGGNDFLGGVAAGDVVQKLAGFEYVRGRDVRAESFA